MSWFSDNYEKAALGGAVVVALAFGAGVVSNMGAVEESFSRDSVKPNNDVSVPGLEKITSVKESLEETHLVEQADVDGRKVNLMTGVPLFAKRGDINRPVDLRKSPPVHKGIPNDWWLKNHIDPGYSDSPDRDPDGDGFSNREEFIAKSDPNDFGSHPNPITKLKVIDVKSTQYLIKPSDYGDGKFKFALLNTRGVTRNKMGPDPITKGNVIPFVGGPLMKDRLKFAELLEKEEMKNGIAQPVKIWVIEDLKPNKAGTLYNFNRRGRRVGDGLPVGIVDSAIELSLQALEQGSTSFKVEENVRFSLPFDAKAKKKPYLLKKVDLDAKRVVVEYTDSAGVKKTHAMSYGK